MALQEGCFVTLTQRVLWEPLKVRLHYGHPNPNPNPNPDPNPDPNPNPNPNPNL